MMDTLSNTPEQIGEPAGEANGRFLDHLSSATELAAARKFRESEAEILRALSITRVDVRALKLLALVRFKLGRLDEARAVCRQLVTMLPHDAGVRMKLGLIALKLDRLDESVNELEASARLAPDDLRVWSYLGFAYARCGEPAQAAAAFRRAGQENRAVEAEREAATPSARVPEAGPTLTAAPTRAENHDASPSPATTTTLSAVPGSDPAMRAAVGGMSGVVAPASGTRFEPPFDLSAPLEPREPKTDTDRFLTNFPGAGGAIPVLPLIGYAVSRLAPAAAQAAWVGATARLAIGDEIYVRADAAVACSGTARWEAAHRRVRGRATEERLGGNGVDGQLFCRVTGRGDVFVAAPAGRLVPLRLEDDILYIREDRVLAFEGTVAWEYGHIPGSHFDVRMLQFRGSGLVAIRVDGEPGVVKVTPEKSLYVTAAHLVGWVGRVAASGTPGARLAAGDENSFAGPAPFGIMCEGEGVVLVDVQAAGAGAAKNFTNGFSRDQQPQ